MPPLALASVPESNAVNEVGVGTERTQRMRWKVASLVPVIRTAWPMRYGCAEEVVMTSIPDERVAAETLR